MKVVMMMMVMMKVVMPDVLKLPNSWVNASLLSVIVMYYLLLFYNITIVIIVVVIVIITIIIIIIIMNINDIICPWTTFNCYLWTLLHVTCY